MSLSPQASPWSAEQQGWLAALGYTVWLTGEAASAEPEPVEVATRAGAPTVMSETVATPAPAMHAPRREATAPKAPAFDQAPASERPRTPAVRPRPASRLPDRLHFALIRASGCNPNAEGASEIFAQWPASSELRGNPAAKRALWPRLRALRRPSAP